MKKILIIFLFALVFVLVGCGGPKVESIEVMGFQTTYEIGADLDLTDVYVWVYYEDETEESVQATEDMFYGFDTVTVGEKTCTVKYKGKTIELNYTVEPRTYSVNINVNNSDYGRVNIENVKLKYNYGDTVNVTVAPNEGYYLRSYSDSESKSLLRTIVVDKDINITVNLRKGEGCSFYGYYLAVENEIEERTMAKRDGNVSSYIKFTPNQTFSSGDFRLYCSDINKFSCWVFKKEDDASYKKVYSSRIDTTTLDEDELTELLGEKTGEWIDIYEYETNVGVAYSVYDINMDLDDGLYVNTAKFKVSDFANSNLKYLYYYNNQLQASEFTTIEENVYTYSFSFDSTAFIQTLRIFEVDGELWYFTSNGISYMLSKGDSRSFGVTVNSVEYKLTFKHVNN